MALVNQKPFRSKTWWIGILLMGLTCATFWITRDYGRAGIMPGLVSLAILGLALLHTVLGVAFGVVVNDEEWHDEADRADFRKRSFVYVAMALAVGIGVTLVGFHITLPVFLFSFILAATRNWLVGAFLSAFMFFFTYVILAQTLHIIFPASVLRRFLIASNWF